MASEDPSPHSSIDEPSRFSARRFAALRYGVATLVVALKLLLDPLIEEQSPFLMLAVAVMVAAWFGGLGPGLLATALGALAADYFFLRRAVRSRGRVRGSCR
jgi:K+-sensing histidine kinase KdpD